MLDTLQLYVDKKKGKRDAPSRNGDSPEPLFVVPVNQQRTMYVIAKGSYLRLAQAQLYNSSIVMNSFRVRVK